MWVSYIVCLASRRSSRNILIDGHSNLCVEGSYNPLYAFCDNLMGIMHEVVIFLLL